MLLIFILYAAINAILKHGLNDSVIIKSNYRWWKVATIAK